MGHLREGLWSEGGKGDGSCVSPSLWILNRAPVKPKEAPGFELQVRLHPWRSWLALASSPCRNHWSNLGLFAQGAKVLLVRDCHLLYWGWFPAPRVSEDILLCGIYLNQ